MIERALDLLSRCRHESCDSQRRVMPETMLFNEGWLLRIVLDWFAENPQLTGLPISIPRDGLWFSEALLRPPEPFKAKPKLERDPDERGESYAESSTHVDAAIGHFNVGQDGSRTGLKLSSNARHFIVLEAKLKSKLSKGIKNAPDYNQAARTIACMAQAIKLEQIDIKQFNSIGFYVIAPKSQLSKHRDQLVRTSLIKAVRDRAAMFASSGFNWFESHFKPMFHQDVFSVETLSWEEIGSVITQNDKAAGREYAAFYEKCKLANDLQG